MARYLLGRIEHKQGDLDAARTGYLEAIALEQRQQPPDVLNLRHDRSRLTGLDEEQAAEPAAE